MITKITTANFESEVAGSSIPVVLDFWAPWCGFCTQLAPTIDEIAADYDGKIKVGKVNIDEEPQLAAKFGVMSIPVCAKFEGGEMKAKVLGAYPKAELIKNLQL
ncbi:thioredoxin [Aminicella lysinilytica]|uniref:Thioredoxin n=1 Tax=Aminicella lysinilytica TaxID=433323 RepID=A0A4R6Q9L2_9FIRM|nr:thioredoxin [Aminicella lysinilytica]TDP58991.1 thioredoxin [Aminicella lysinilytica]